MSTIDRRSFLAALPLSGLALSAGAGSKTGLWAAARPRGIEAGRFGPALRGVGVQLYTLRTLMGDGPDAVLARLAEIGYTEVELAGTYGLSPRELRRRLDAEGLTAVSSHLGIDAVRERWSETLEGAQELGQSLIVVPSIPSSEQSPDGLRRVAEDFNRAGEAARAAGIRFGYHNHAWEVEAMADGRRRMDLLLEWCEPDLVDWQMDVFWTVHGGADPMAYLRDHGQRITSVHIKDRTPDGTMVAAGDGAIDFASILERASGLGLRHGFVEHDNPDDPLESVARSYRAVIGMGVIDRQA